MKKYNFAIVGATGVVGRTFLEAIEAYNLPIGELRLFASERSVGKKIVFMGKEYELQALKKGCFVGIDYALFSAGGAVSKEWAPIAVSEGAIAVDNSSTFRADDGCALVVPEINMEDIARHGNLIANPNCSTIQCVLPLKVIEDLFHLTRVVYSTYQATSGSGKKGLDDLEAGKRGEPMKFYPHDISKTCIPEIDVFGDDGYSKEEMKMVLETRKILHRPELAVVATCVRVPVPVGHGVSVLAECEKPVDLALLRKALSEYEGIRVMDDPKNHQYPVSTVAVGNDFVYVGRIRKDISSPNAILFYCVADNLRKGAAGNAVQIVKKLIQEKEHGESL